MWLTPCLGNLAQDYLKREVLGNSDSSSKCNSPTAYSGRSFPTGDLEPSYVHKET